MTQRLFRAKRKIRDAVIPFRMPVGEQFQQRLGAVLAVLYLVFNEGYHATGGDGLPRAALCDEAVRLTGLLADWMDDPEVAGLLALMELHDARRAARTDDQGDLVPLDEQDRSRWDHDRIAAAVARLRGAMEAGRAGPYQLQASIAACHATAPTAEATDWARIAELYAVLVTVVPGPVVELNRAVAVALSGRVEDGLAMVESLIDAGALADYHLLFATR